MSDAIRAMIDRRQPVDQTDWIRALREALQEAALAGLWRNRFFAKAAFYGGTALRLFHGLDRFSEDLDFTLLAPDAEWKLEDSLPGLRTELEGFGFSVTVQARRTGPINSAFVKANTRLHLIQLSAPREISDRLPASQLIRVKLETDTDPPPGITTEVRTLLDPFPVSIRVATPACLFAGKLHACLWREWRSRVKGRDWFDLLFLVARGTHADIDHLTSRGRQSGHWKEKRAMEPADAERLLLERIDRIDWRQAAADVAPFVRDARSLDLWGRELFREAVGRVRYGRGKSGES